MDFDCILYQSKTNWDVDRYDILSAERRSLPSIYIEHDSPRQNPTDTRHPVDDPGILLVHVTTFNDLMWDSGSIPTQVIDHGVKVTPGVAYSGELDRGIAVVNGMGWRGRRVGR
ncbi:MAG: glycosyltransferase family 1 protein, partial [Actinobacteria bacterium]|nr:glycosyltransferase family 1 protein [Actinomycetota bacterium]